MKAAIIGLGRIGFEFGLEKRVQPASHVACYNALSEIDVIAVCDVDTNKLAPALATIDKTKKAYSNYHEMMREFQPEVVSICTPTPTHREIVCNVATYPCVKSMFLEKPIAQSLKEADKIIEACRKNNVKLTVNYTRRWDSIYDLTRLGGIPITLLGIHHGPLLRTGTHMIDLFNKIIDSEPLLATAFGEPHENYITNKPGVNDYNISGSITYKGGIQAVLLSGRQKPYLLFELDIFKEKWRFRITENGRRMEQFKAYPSSRYQNLQELDIHSTNLERSTNPLLNAIKEVACNPYQTSCNGEQARLTLQVALALHESAMHNNEIVAVNLVPEDYTVRSY